MEMNSRIRNYIKENGMTFSFVANRAGIELKKFSRFMNNRQAMTVDEYEQVCSQGLRVDPTFFYGQKVLETKNKSA